MGTKNSLKDVNLCMVDDNHFCFGCCGHDYTTKESIMWGIKKNTLEMQDFKDKIEFANRAKLLRCSGICKNLTVLPDGRVGCPLHPVWNEGNDLRLKHKDCNTKYLCKVFFKYVNDWDDAKRQRFLDFVDSLKLDWFDYSIKMDDDSLLKEFEKKEGE